MMGCSVFRNQKTVFEGAFRFRRKHTHISSSVRSSDGPFFEAANKKTFFHALFSHQKLKIEYKTCRIFICRTQNPEIQQAGRCVAAHGEAARQGGAGQNGTPTDRFAQETTVHPALQGIEDNCPERFSEARTKEILCKPMGEQSPRLTRRLSPGPRALSPWLLTSVPTLICLCKTFSCKACPGNTDLPNERFEAVHSKAAGRGGTGQDRTPTGRFAQDTTVPLAPQGIEDN